MRALFILACSSFGGHALAETANIIGLPGAPLRISAYQVIYEARRGEPGTVFHQARITNDSDQEVLAFSVRFLAFDSFNEYMGRPASTYVAETLAPGETLSRNFFGAVQQFAGTERFQGYGTGYTYVEKARLEDGTVWIADTAVVLEELRKLQASLTAADLAEEP